MSEPRVIRFTAHGEPVPWQRAGRGKGWTYTPKRTADWQTFIRWAFTEAAPRWEAFDGPVSLDVTAYLLPPLTVQRKKANKAALDAECIPVTKKPDLDNVAMKSVMDALNKLAYVDDARVWDARLRKVYSMRPRLEIAMTFGTDEGRAA